MDWPTLGLNIATAALSIAGLGVPAVIAGAATLLIKNQAVAGAVTQAAGVAYTHLAQAFEKDQTVSFASAQDAAVAAGISAVASLAPNSKTISAVTGAFGQLLSGDPNFNVVNPTGALGPLVAASAAPLVSYVTGSAPVAAIGTLVSDVAAAAPKVASIGSAIGALVADVAAAAPAVVAVASTAAQQDTATRGGGN